MNPELLADRAERLLLAHPYPGARADALVRVLEVAQPLRLAPGALLCQEGEAANALFILLEGSVAVTRRDAQGHAKALATLEAPALVGQMAMIDHSPRSATCTAATPVRALALERPQWTALLGESSPRGTALRRLLLSSLCQQAGSAIHHLRRLVAGTTLEEDLTGGAAVQALVEPSPTASFRSAPGPVVTLPPSPVPPPPGRVAPRESLPAPAAPPRPASTVERAPDELTEEDLLEVTNLLEGWKRRR